MSILLDHLTKLYGTQAVVNGVSLEIADGELFVLLGASGSGKSTILRMIAGLTPCDSGRILLQGRDVTHLAPQPRGTGFVFQNYSIFRHMTVAENIEFGLKIRKMAKAERTKRGEELLDLVGLAGLGNRYPDQISGGQQQRVALARALAYEPAVLLLDEPLGALDVKIRVQLRRSLKEIQRRLKVTTILVTHDQEEAYELADRIGVLERGVLLEVGEPEQLYAQPRTLFVASFLGAGTVLAGRVENGQARFGSFALPIPDVTPHEEGASVELLFRPEQVVLSPEEPKSQAPVLGRGAIVEQTFSGAMRRLRLRVPRLSATRQVAPTVPFGEEGFIVDALTPSELPSPANDLWVSLRGWSILEQAQPRLLVVDTGLGADTALHYARLLAQPMQASVTVLGFAPGTTSEELHQALKRRMQAAGIEAPELHVNSGNFVQQIAAECAGALFELLILPPRLDERTAGLDDSMIALLERADLPVFLACGESKSVLARVLICTRAGEPGKSDIRFGGRLAHYLRAAVTLLHVTIDAAGASRLARWHLHQASATLKALEVANQVVVRSDPDPAATILSETSAHDLVVIGGHGPHSRSVFGRDDITIQVLTHTTCPVLVVPAEER